MPCRSGSVKLTLAIVYKGKVVEASGNECSASEPYVEFVAVVDKLLSASC